MAAAIFASAPTTPAKPGYCASRADITAEEALLPVISNEWVNDEYKHMIVEATPKTLAAVPGQFFNIMPPAPDEGELWLRRPQSIYQVDKANGRLEFLYKCVGRGTKGMATLKPGDNLDVVGPLGQGAFEIPEGAKNIVVLGRGVGLATLAPISQLAKEKGIGVTALLSARSPELAMGADLYEKVGTVVKLLDTDGTSSVENVEKVLRQLIADKKADAFFTCGSARLQLLMKKLGKEFNIPGQVAMEQVMACGLGPCYVCIRAFEDDHGHKDLRRVCFDGPVFNLQEAL